MAPETQMVERRRRRLTSGEVRPPDINERNALEQAVVEMKACKDIFVDWDGQMRSIPTPPWGLELVIKRTTKALCDEAESALAETEGLIRAHLQYTSLMTNILRATASDPAGTVHFTPEIARVMDRMCQRSEQLMYRVSSIEDNLTILVDTFEEIERRHETKSLWDIICLWLRKVCSFLAAALTTASCLADRHRSDAMNTLASILRQYGESEEHDPREMLHFFRETLPTEMAIVTKRLINFKSCIDIAKLQLEQDKGTILNMTRVDALRASVLWRIRNTDMQLIPLRPENTPAKKS